MRLSLIVLVCLLLALPADAQRFPTPPPPEPIFPAPQYATELTFASVTVPRLNVRTAPDLDAPVVDILRLGERAPIAGQTRDGEWLLLTLSGGQGWVFADLVIVINPEGVPDPDDLTLTAEQEARIDQQIAVASNTIGVRTSLRVRDLPSPEGRVVDVIQFGDRAVPIARDEFGIWVKVDYNGTIGWVNVFYIVPPPGFNLQALPVTDR